MAEALTLSPEQVQSWADEIARLNDAISGMEQKRDALQQRLDAVNLIFGNVVASSEKMTLRGYIIDHLQSAEAGITLGELLEVMERSPFREQVMRNRNTLYTAVTRLTERGEIVRHGKLLYSKDLFQAIADGTARDPRFDRAGEEITVPDLILKILSDAGKALSPAEILDVVRVDERFSEKMLRNPQYGYTVLGRMVSRKQIEKRDKKYALPGTGVEVDPSSLF